MQIETAKKYVVEVGDDLLTTVTVWPDHFTSVMRLYVDYADRERNEIQSSVRLVGDPRKS